MYNTKLLYDRTNVFTLFLFVFSSYEQWFLLFFPYMRARANKMWWKFCQFFSGSSSTMRLSTADRSSWGFGQAYLNFFFQSGLILFSFYFMLLFCVLRRFYIVLFFFFRLVRFIYFIFLVVCSSVLCIPQVVCTVVMFCFVAVFFSSSFLPTCLRNRTGVREIVIIMYR